MKPQNLILTVFFIVLCFTNCKKETATIQNKTVLLFENKTWYLNYRLDSSISKVSGTSISIDSFNHDKETLLINSDSSVHFYRPQLNKLITGKWTFNNADSLLTMLIVDQNSYFYPVQWISFIDSSRMIFKLRKETWYYQSSIGGVYISDTINRYISVYFNSKP